MAESDPAQNSGSDLEQTDGTEGGGSLPRTSGSNSGKKRQIGSVRALAIKKVSNETHPHSFAGVIADSGILPHFFAFIIVLSMMSSSVSHSGSAYP